MGGQEEGKEDECDGKSVWDGEFEEAQRKTLQWMDRRKEQEGKKGEQGEEFN